MHEIGTHSILKGATTFLCGQPGGPSAMSLCIRGGWSLGGGKDVYVTDEAKEDEICERMLSMRLLHEKSVACSPPQLVAPNLNDEKGEARRSFCPSPKT